MRARCFANAESYSQHFAQLRQLLDRFLHKFINTEVARFFRQNFPIYENVGMLQQRYGNNVRQVVATFLIESLANATAASDDVNVSMHIAPKGVLLDVRQIGGPGFEEAFLADLQEKAAEVCRRLTAGETVKNLGLETGLSWRRAIGYVPPDIPPAFADMPYRGNGARNTLLNGYVRTNLIADASGNHTVTLHTAEQLQSVDRYERGDRTAIPNLYAPRGAASGGPQAVSAAPTRQQVIDDLFSGGL